MCGIINPATNRCIACGEPDIDLAEVLLYRNADPVESKNAALKLKAAKDRMRVLKTFDGRDLTYRQAGTMAAEDDAEQARLESLRRRGSDLKTLDLIEQIGTEDGQGVFALTDKGRRYLSIDG